MHVPAQTRRQFLQRAMMAGAAGCLAGPAFAKPGFDLGLQLYTVRDPMAKAPIPTLRQIGSLGYRNLETFGFDADRLYFYDMPAADFRRVLDDLDLRTSSGHYDLFKYLEAPEAALRDYVGRCIDGARVLGQRYITWPWLSPEQRTIRHFELLADRLNLAGRQVAAAGLQVAYHNHDFEFIPQGGKLGYDIIMQRTDPALVKLQLDMYWSAHSSQRSAHELFTLQPGRFVMWHVKDMDKKTRDYTELGNGSIDYTKIMAEAALSGLEEYFVEQGDNFAVDPMSSIATSAAYAKRHLQ